MRDEYNALINIGTWELVSRHMGVNILSCMWIYTHKENDKGNHQRHKARLVCDGRRLARIVMKLLVQLFVLLLFVQCWG